MAKAGVCAFVHDRPSAHEENGPANDPMFAIRSPAYAISRTRRAQ
jgi:hypothetical protein